MGSVVGEELVRLVFAGEVLDTEVDNLGVRGRTLRKRFISLEVDLVCFSAAGTSSNTTFHGSFLVSFCLRGLLVLLMTGGELLLDLICRSSAAVCHPWVTDDINNTEAFVRVLLEHASHKILELIGEEAFRMSSLMGFPEEVSPVGGDHFVELVAHVSLAERRGSRVQDEQDHSKCKEINVLTLIWATRHDLRGHVTWGADLR